MNKEPEKPDLRYADISIEKSNNMDIKKNIQFIPSFEDIMKEGNEQKKLANDINKKLLGLIKNYSKDNYPNEKKLTQQKENHNNTKIINLRNCPPNLKLNCFPSNPNFQKNQRSKIGRAHV